MRRELSSNFSTLQGLSPNTPPIASLDRGGLAQIRACQGGSRTRFAILCLGLAQSDPPSPSFSKEKEEAGYGIWIADEGHLYPLAVHPHFPLSHLLLVKTPTAKDSWQVGLDAVQSGLFQTVLLRPSERCPDIFLRKMQLAAGKTGSRVLILYQHALPHWTLKTTFEAQAV